MFGQVHGLPIHALIVHATVTLLPLTALLAIAFVVPRWRAVLRWPLVALAAASFVVVIVTRQSGEAMKTAVGDQLTGNVTGMVVADHEELGTRLAIAMAVLLAVAMLAALVHGMRGSDWLRHLSAAGLVVAAAAVLVLTVQTGEAGAKARWNPDGSLDYSAS